MNLLPLLLLLAQTDLPQERHLAIVIGNGAYSKEPLPGATRAAVRVQSAFAALGFETALIANAGLGELSLSLHELTRTLTSSDTVVVYFHGYTMRTDTDNLLLPIDFRAGNVSQAKQCGYSTVALIAKLQVAGAAIVILDPGGDQPFELGKEKPAGFATVKPAKNTFVALASTPGKELAQVDWEQAETWFGHAFLEALREQGSYGLVSLFSSVRTKVREASGGRQMPWTTEGSRALGDIILNASSLRGTTENRPKKEETWDEISARIQVAEMLSQRKAQRDANRREAVARLDKAYEPEKTEAALKAQKNEFETTPVYLARTVAERAVVDRIEHKYKAERAKLEAAYNDTTGDPDTRTLETLKAGPFRGPCKAEWIQYDADHQLLTLYVGGMDRTYHMPIEQAKQFKPRSSMLICDGAFTPESVSAGDPEGMVKLTEVAWNPVRLGSPGVTSPRVIRQREPEYTEWARNAHIQGTVLLKLLVDENGSPRAIRVVRRLGFGLDEMACAAMRQWRFQPATKDGQPVVSEATIEVSFRLL